jgi:hypothetical protein
MGCVYDEAWSDPREETPPRSSPTSSSEQTPPRPSPASATCYLRISQKAIPPTVSCTVESPRAGSAMVSGRLPPRPSMASASIISMKECPTSPEATELMYHQGLFAILTTAPTTMTWTASPSDMLGYVTEPSALTLALCVSKALALALALILPLCF